MKLYTKITIGLVAGIAVGWVLNMMYDDAPFRKVDEDQDEFVTIPELLEAQEGMAHLRRNDALNAADTDRNGVVTWQELVDREQREARSLLENSFPQADVNGDGKLSLNEVMGGPADLNTRLPASAVARADTSGDGFVSLQEALLLLSENDFSNTERRFHAVDADGDGALTHTEIVQANDFSELVAMESFGKADLNSDGRLTIKELALRDVNLQRYLVWTEFQRVDSDGDGRIALKEDKAVNGWQAIAIFIEPVGRIFINLVKMVVVPLVLASLILGAANLGDVRKLGSIGLKAFGFFMLTTTIAVSIGVASANLLQPGKGLPEEKRDELVAQYRSTTDAKVESVTTGPQQSEYEKLTDLLVRMVPTNPIKALAEGDMLAIIFFAIFFGLCLTLIPPSIAAPFLQFMEGLNEVILKMVTLAMETAPYGVFALITGVVATMGIEIMATLLFYGLVVVGALVLHLIITHFSFIVFYLKQSPFKFLAAIKEAILLGFSTSSSSATLPISMNVAQANLGVSREVSSFVLPLGATINMDGTALYQGVAAIFIAQVYGIDLSFSAQLTMVLTATLASVGAAGVPGAGMITLAVVLGTAGIPIEGIALIFGLDRLLDMFRTTVNIIGDITCAAVMAKSEGETLVIRKDQDIIEG